MTSKSAFQSTRWLRRAGQSNGPMQVVGADQAARGVSNKKLVGRPTAFRRTPPQSRQPACKPGSVRRRLAPARDGHSSGTPVAWRLEQPTRAADPDIDPEDCSSAPPLFGFAPGGVCRAAPVAGRAVRSYRTVSPLPLCRSKPAVSSLWHFPWGHPRRTLSGTVCPWSPDFPPRRPFGACRDGRPAD